MLEEMPPFPERESSILAKLKKKKGTGTVSEADESRKERNANVNGSSDHTAASTNAKVGFFFGLQSYHLFVNLLERGV